MVLSVLNHTEDKVISEELFSLDVTHFLWPKWQDAFPCTEWGCGPPENCPHSLLFLLCLRFLYTSPPQSLKNPVAYCNPLNVFQSLSYEERLNFSCHYICLGV